MEEEIIVEPPLYFAPDSLHIWSTHFHPHQDVLAASLINGHIQMYVIGNLDSNIPPTMSFLLSPSQKHIDLVHVIAALILLERVTRCLLSPRHLWRR